LLPSDHIPRQDTGDITHEINAYDLFPIGSA